MCQLSFLFGGAMLCHRDDSLPLCESEWLSQGALGPTVGAVFAVQEEKAMSLCRAGDLAVEQCHPPLPLALAMASILF